MKTKELKILIKKVLEDKNKDISNHAALSPIAAGLASEGYSGGYRDALEDVFQALSGVLPQRWYSVIEKD